MVEPILKVPRCRVATVGAIFDSLLPFEEWASIGKRIIQASECVQWLIGDWLNFGWSCYVESAGKDAPLLRVKYKSALESLPYQYQTLANFSWVAKSVEFSRRKEKLSFKHHQEVASLSVVDQNKYLAVAEKNNMSAADLRELIRANQGSVKNGKESRHSSDGVMQHVHLLSNWAKQEDPTQWPKRRRDAVKEEIRPIVELYNRL